MTPANGPPLILASGSSARRQILTSAGLAFTVQTAGVDEGRAKTAMLAEGASPHDIADALAELKALGVSLKAQGLVIGADQTLDLDGVLMDKAENLAQAATALRALRGRTHRLHSAVVLARDGEVIWRQVQSASLTMRPFTDAFLATYLDRHGQAVLPCVGCYRLESEGVQLFDRIDGDYFTILGLPIVGLLHVLRGQGLLAS
jgi:septum formation protein